MPPSQFGYFRDIKKLLKSTIILILVKNDIPFKYFDLDTDNYNEVFGGDFEIDKEYTSHAPTWVGFEDRYNELANISKEYISIRNIAQPYTPPKL